MALDVSYIKIIFSDYFFQSMILLKYEFGWDFEDVVYFATNERADRKDLSFVFKLKISNIGSYYWLKVSKSTNSM